MTIFCPYSGFAMNVAFFEGLNVTFLGAWHDRNSPVYDVEGGHVSQTLTMLLLEENV